MLVNKLKCIALFVLAMALVLAAADKPPVIEHLAWGSAGSYSQGAYVVAISDPNLRTDFVSPVLISFSVPKSKGSPALFFEIYAHFWYRLAGTSTWDGQGGIFWEFLSNDIPADIEVTNALGVLELHLTNNSLDEAFERSRVSRTWKMILRRDSLDFSRIRYKGTNTDVPQDEALAIINKLIDNGFDVQVWTEGYVQGFRSVMLNPLNIEVTRLSKN
jgi:hypothetical protein